MKILFEKLERYRSLPVKNYEADSVVTGVLAALCWEYRSMNIDSAIFYCEEDIRLSKKINFARGIASAYHQMGAIHRQRGELEKAIDFYYKALDIWRSFQKSNPSYYSSTIIIQEGRTLNNLGIIYLLNGETTKAFDLFLQSFKIDEAKGNKEGIANKLGNIGNIFKEQGQYDKALEYYTQSLKIDDSIGNKGRMAQCYSDMGLVYWQKKDKNKAIEYHTKAIDINKSIGNKQELSENYVNIAIICDEEKKYNEALDYYNKSLQLKAQTGDRPGIALVFENIGSMYLDRNMLPEAEDYLLRAKSIFDSIGVNEGPMELYMNLSSLHSKKEQYKEALEYQKKATALKDSLFNQKKTIELTRKEMNYENEKKEAIARAEYEKQVAVAKADKLRGIAEADKKRILAELSKNLELADAAKKLTESETNKLIAVSEADNKRILAETERKSASMKAEKQMGEARSENQRQKLIRNVIALGAGIIILSSLLIFFAYKRKRDADQKQKETALNLKVSEIEMKALRSQMNPHFIFNALQSIQTFLMNHKPDEAHTYLLKFSKLMRLVLENSQYPEVPVKEDIQALELYMQLECIRLPHPFTYQIHIDKNVDPESDTILPLILQPFVENAIWHGLQYKPVAGHIAISLSKKGNNLYATVIDNGVGRTNAEKNIKPLLAKHESLGIKLTQDRLNTLNESKHVNAGFTITDLFDEQQQPAGTKVELSLPLA
jgi:LytS/YehU family sensor histidine kinase/tetratricopeptide (TPR) repeat protein